MAVNTVTLQELRNLFYSVLNEVETSTTYPVALADVFLNNAQDKICSGGVVINQTKEQLKKTVLPFIDKDKQYTSVTDQYLDADLSVGSTTITVSDTTWFASSGALWINGNIVTYSAITATQFTGVPATGDGSIEFAFQQWTPVSQLYALPTNFWTSARLIYNAQYQVPYVDYRNIYTQLKDFKGYSGDNNQFSTNTLQSRFGINPFYTIIHGEYFLPFQLNVTSKQIWLQYEKKPTYMSLTTDLATIPDEFSRITIPLIAVSLMFANRGEENRGQILNDNIGYSAVQSMYTYYERQWAEDMFGQRTLTSRDSWLNI